MIRMAPSEIVRRSTLVLTRERHFGLNGLQRARTATEGRIVTALQALKDPAPTIDAASVPIVLTAGGLGFHMAVCDDPTWQTMDLKVVRDGRPFLIVNTGSLPPESPYRSVPASATTAAAHFSSMIRAAAAAMVRVARSECIDQGDPGWIDPLHDVCVAIGHHFRPGSPEMTLMIPRTPFSPLKVATFEGADSVLQPVDDWDEVARPACSLDVVHDTGSSAIRFATISVNTNAKDPMETLRTLARVAEMRNSPWWK